MCAGDDKMFRNKARYFLFLAALMPRIDAVCVCLGNDPSAAEDLTKQLESKFGSTPIYLHFCLEDFEEISREKSCCFAMSIAFPA